MDPNEKVTLAELSDRLARVEAAVANHVGDHTGWLLALQAIAAVLFVRHAAAAADPETFSSQCEEWAKNIVNTTEAAPTIPSETAEKIREMALDKVEKFFRGISIKQ